MVDGVTLTMGVAGSKLEKALGDHFPEGERYFGLENFGNTCYCNSALQALYFCVPFREQILEYYSNNKSQGESDENLLTCLAELFSQINSQKKKTGVIAPKRFVQRLRKENDVFRGYMHQLEMSDEMVVAYHALYGMAWQKGFLIDAHEFLNFLLNQLVDILEKEHLKATREIVSNGQSNGHVNGVKQELALTWVHKNFQVKPTDILCLPNFIHCSHFARSPEKDEDTEITSYLGYSSQAIQVHGTTNRHKKLSYRVVFPLELKLSTTLDAGDSEYSLFAVVVHLGTGPNHGHYITLNALYWLATKIPINSVCPRFARTYIALNHGQLREV
ncbi:hypothetical protein SASPL_115490 [Salvia splendens]|uniref:ubiquitinyl hydrolase 1 n=1 Tax=Salvia splendens TaxID=180675 RepID=A0A8X9A267_SALSN|nr:hypothetical protein SASPL_115490 [Salvia splendens]